MKMWYHQAQATIRESVCAACWGDLDYIQPDKTNAQITNVFCTRCKDATPGFVSKKWAEKKARENEMEFFEARRALRDAIPWLKPKSGLTAADILRSLGYT